jgi:hypothetical protein
MLLLLALICAAPIAVSYFVYYVVKPAGGTTNYGALVEPQRPIPDSLVVTGEDGKPLKLASLRGHWLMISVDNSACDKSAQPRARNASASWKCGCAPMQATCPT